MLASVERTLKFERLNERGTGSIGSLFVTNYKLSFQPAERSSYDTVGSSASAVKVSHVHSCMLHVPDVAYHMLQFVAASSLSLPCPSCNVCVGECATNNPRMNIAICCLCLRRQMILHL